MTDILEQMKENLAKNIDRENQERWQTIKGILFDVAPNAEEIERACGSEAAMQKTLEVGRILAYLSPKEKYDVLKWLAVGILKNAPERSRSKIRKDFIEHVTKMTS